MKTKGFLKVVIVAVGLLLIFNTGYYLGAINQQGFDATPRAFMAASAIEMIYDGETDKAQLFLLRWVQTDLSSFMNTTNYGTKYAAYLAPIHLFLKADSVDYAKRLNEKFNNNRTLFDGVVIEENYVR